MKNNILKQIRNAITASLKSMTLELLAEERANKQLSKNVDDFLIKHPADYLKPAEPKTAPVTKKRVMKSLGSSSVVAENTEASLDPELLERARAFCRKLVVDGYGTTGAK